ncbi:hypothetical protein Tco_0489307 [Tanacetum coccineum]
MKFESAHSNTTAKLPILKLGESEIWVIRIKQYFQVQDYALWEVIKNGNSWVSVPQTAQENGTSVTKISVHVTAEEKTKKKNDVKARILLLMALPNEHQLNFSQYTDSKIMFATIETRFGAPKIVSRLAILGVVIAQEDLNSKFLSSLPPEWNTHVKSVGASSGAQNLAFMTVPSTSSTNDTAKHAYEVSIVSPNVNTASPQVSTASFSDNDVYAFMVKNLNGSNLLQQDLEQIHEDDLEVMDLNGDPPPFSLLSIGQRVLKREVACKDYESNVLKSEFEKVKQEKEAIEFRIEKFDKASKDIDKLLGSQITDKSQKQLKLLGQILQLLGKSGKCYKDISMCELEQHMAYLVQANLAMEERMDKHGSRLYKLENLDIPHQVSKAVDEIVTDAVDWAIQAPLRDRFRDLPEADMKEILHHRMWESNSYKAHEDHKKLYEALEKSMDRDQTDQLLTDLAEARRKKKRRHDSPKTPPGSPPHQPPPPPPPAGPSGTSGSSGASGSSQLPPPPPPPSTNQSDQSKTTAAPSSSKTAASAEYTAWTTIDTRLKPYV